MSIQVIINILCFLFGSLIGSFLNVVIYRVPRELSVVTPRSSCPNCNHEIKWYENIPIISYLFLKGKCSNCKQKVSVRYPLVELLMGVVAMLLAPSDFAITSLINFSFYFSVAAIFLAHLMIDIEFKLLPDKINLYFLLITIPYSIANLPLFYWLAGGLIGFLGPCIITVLFYKLRGVVGLGGGDIKLFGILGLILGPFGILSNMFMSCMLGSIVGLGLIVTKKMSRDSAFAFGPFIIIAASVQIFMPEFFAMINPFSLK